MVNVAVKRRDECRRNLSHGGGIKVKATGEHAKGNHVGVNRREQRDAGRAISASR